MKHKFLAFAMLVGVAAVAPLSPASALGAGEWVGERDRAWSSRGAEGGHGQHRHGPWPYGCPMNSASEGNANQQNFPVKQYGQTAGGNRC